MTTAHLFPELHGELIALLRSLPDAAWDAPTSAGAWRVRDVAAHLLDGDLRRIARDRDGHSPPPPAGPITGHAALVGWLDDLNAEWVAAARRISPPLLVEMLEVTGPIVADVIARHDPAAPATYPVAWAGQRASPMWLDIGREFTERWHHQDQIRIAVGSPVLDAPHLLRPVIDISLHALPAAYASLQSAPGTRLELAVSGPAGGTWSVIRDEDGWIVQDDATRPGSQREGATSCRIAVDALTLARLLLHCLPRERVADSLRVEGDAALAEPLFRARAVMVRTGKADPTITPAPDELEQLRYPIGRMAWEPALAPAARARHIADIAGLPGHLLRAVDGLTAVQLETPYRPGGWTLRQVVHHVADSHINSYVRFRLAATGDEPHITAYDEAAWAELADARSMDVAVSLRLIDALHARWITFLNGLRPADFARAYRHPELGTVSLDAALQMYSWHGRHHVAHIVNARSRAGW